MNIRGKCVLLRAIEREDLSSIHLWSNDPETQGMLGGWHFPSSVNDMEQWFLSLHGDPLSQRFAIATEADGLIGTANLVDIDWKNRNAFHGMMLGPMDKRRKGYGTDTVMAVMRYAFEELGLHRLETSIIEFNEPSLGLYVTKCAWREEGRARQAYWRRGRWWDKILVAITEDEYRALVASSRYWA